MVAIDIAISSTRGAHVPESTLTLLGRSLVIVRPVFTCNTGNSYLSKISNFTSRSEPGRLLNTRTVKHIFYCPVHHQLGTVLYFHLINQTCVVAFVVVVVLILFSTVGIAARIEKPFARLVWWRMGRIRLDNYAFFDTLSDSCCCSISLIRFRLRASFADLWERMYASVGGGRRGGTSL